VKYNINIMGRDELLYKCKSKDLNKCIVISINCPNNPTEIKNENIIDILKLEFHDIETPKENLVAMSVADGFKIKEFIEKYKNTVDSIIIHCTAGISRSAGIGCAIAMYLNGSDDYLWASGNYIPSKRCYKITLEALGLEISEDEIKEKQMLSEKGFEPAFNKFCTDYGIKISDMF